MLKCATEKLTTPQWLSLSLSHLSSLSPLHLYIRFERMEQVLI